MILLDLTQLGEALLISGHSHLSTEWDRVCFPCVVVADTFLGLLFSHAVSGIFYYTLVLLRVCPLSISDCACVFTSSVVGLLSSPRCGWLLIVASVPEFPMFMLGVLFLIHYGLWIVATIFIGKLGC